MTQTTMDAGIAAGIANEVRKLTEQGYTPKQARKLVRDVIRAAAKHETPTELGLIDCDGDVWTRVKDQPTLWLCPAEPSYAPRTREFLREEFGPLTEVMV